MGAWLNNPNTGGLTYQEQPLAEDEAERQQRLANLRNRLSGNAGHGLMFTNTAGGVQRAYDPAYSSSNQMKNQPYSVGSGRSSEANDIEKQYASSLQGIGGTAKTAITDRLQGVSKTLSEMDTVLPEYKIGGLSDSQFSEAMSSNNPTNLTTQLKNKAAKTADQIIAERLGSTNSEISEATTDAERLRQQLAGINILPTSTGAQTSKESAGIKNAIRKLMSTRVDDSGASLFSKRQYAENELGTAQEQADFTRSLYDVASGDLTTAKEGYGQDEITKLMSGLEVDRGYYNTLQDANNPENWYYEGIPGQKAADTRASVLDVLSKVTPDFNERFINDLVARNKGGLFEDNNIYRDIISDLVNSGNIKKALWGAADSEDIMDETVDKYGLSAHGMLDYGRYLIKSQDLVADIENLLPLYMREASRNIKNKYVY